MAVGFRIANLRLQSGERLPLLVTAATGVPLWNPALFIVTELRAINRAAATLQQAVRAIMVAHQVLDHLGVDLDARLDEGRMLDIGELDALASLTGVTQEALDALLTAEAKPVGVRPRVVSLEKARMRAKSSDQPPQVAQARLPGADLSGCGRNGATGHCST